MKLSKITHKNELRIRVEFPYDAATTAQLRQIPDTRWSQSLKCWHVPYTKEVFEQLKALFPDVEYETSRPDFTPNPSDTCSACGSGERNFERVAIKSDINIQPETINRIGNSEKKRNIK